MLAQGTKPRSSSARQRMGRVKTAASQWEAARFDRSCAGRFGDGSGGGGCCDVRLSEGPEAFSHRGDARSLRHERLLDAQPDNVEPYSPPGQSVDRAHLYGIFQNTDPSPIWLPVIEDCAQAIGHAGKKTPFLGRHRDFFSFPRPKLLTTAKGMAVSAEPELVRRIGQFETGRRIEAGALFRSMSTCRRRWASASWRVSDCLAKAQRNRDQIQECLVRNGAGGVPGLSLRTEACSSVSLKLPGGIRNKAAVCGKGIRVSTRG